MADKNDLDWLGGYTLEELLGATPVTKSKKQAKQAKKQAKKAARTDAGKRSLLSTTLGAPFRLVGALIKLPATIATQILKLPVRLLQLLTSPFRRSKNT